MKLPFWRGGRKAPDAQFTTEIQKDGVGFTLTRQQKKYPVVDWAGIRPHSASAIAEILALADGGPTNEGEIAAEVVSEGEITLSFEAVADLSVGAAAALDLPPPTSLALDIKAIGRIDEDDFRLDISWVRLGGQPVRAVLSGPFLKAEGSTWRIPNPLWSLHQIAMKLSAPQEKAARFQVLAELKAACGDDFPEAVVAEPYLKNLRVHYASALSLKLRTLTPEMTEFDPILFGPAIAKEALTEGREPDEEWDSLLSPRSQKLFAEDRFRREPAGRSVYVLRDGEYVFIDPTLRPVLNTVRKLQDAPEKTRRAFILNPRKVLRENLSESDTAVIDIESLFIETEQFSQRVAGVDIWRQTVLPWITPTAENKWLPEKFGLKVGEDYYVLRPENVAVIIEKMEVAKASGKDSADVQGLLESVSPEVAPLGALPVNDQTYDALNSLRPLAEAVSEGANVTWSPGEDVKRAADKLFLIVRENFEDVEFAPLSAQDPANEAFDAAPIILPDLLQTVLKPHQIEGFEWLVNSVRARRTGALLADDMGLGKTLQAIAFMAWLGEDMLAGNRPRLPFLIVAPTGLLGNWQDEIQKHLRAPHLGRLVLAFGGDLTRLRDDSGIGQKDIETGRAALNSDAWRDASVVLTTYETLRDYHFSFARSRFALVIYDEVQKLKNPVSQMTRASKTLNGDFVLGMTGTPVENRLQDLWSIMDIIAPGLLGASRDFEKRYPSDDALKLTSLKTLLTDATGQHQPHMLRRMKSDALKGLPRKEIKQYTVDMPDLQAKVYNDIVVRAAAGAASGTMGRGGMLQILANMRGVSLHPVNPAEAPNDLNDYSKDSARLSKTIAILDEVRQKNEKALVFVEDLAMQDRLATLIQSHFGLKRLPMRINGGVPGPKRQEMVRTFQGEPNRFDVMILSPKAGGVGLTLTTANHVIHLSRWWNPAVEDQATDRVYRIGQSKDVFVHLPLAVHPSPAIRNASFDLRLNALLERKRKLTQDLFMPPEPSDADMRELFTEVVNFDGASAENGPVVEEPAEGNTSSSNLAAQARQTLVLDKNLVQLGAKIWKAPAGKPKPVESVLALFNGREIKQVVIRDPYALATSNAIAAQVKFLAGLSTVCRRIDSVTVEYAPEAVDDDARNRRLFGEKFAAEFPHGSVRVSLSRRSKRSRDDDFHDRSVELHVKHAGGQFRVHEIFIGRGLEALYNDKHECTITYSPPTHV